jgi:hypothetical protein
MTDPWHESKTKYDKLVDALSCAPSIILKAKRLEAGAKHLSPQYLFALTLEIVSDLSSMLCQLDIFYEEMEQEYPKPLYWEHDIDNGHETVLTFRPALYFHDVGVATALTMYCKLLYACGRFVRHPQTSTYIHFRGYPSNGLERPCANSRWMPRAWCGGRLAAYFHHSSQPAEA